MELPIVNIGKLPVTRLVIGGNPFSGFSHQSRERSAEMVAWYTDERIVETLFKAEAAGLSACVCRGDEHITRILKRYWAGGGRMRWIAQTDSHAETAVAGARYCLAHGASACFLHGGIVDNYIAHERYDEIIAFAQEVQSAGIPAGIAGHIPADFLWAERNLALDFYMVSYYNPSPRQDVPHHDPEVAEQYLPEDRDERVATIRQLTRPVIHYKVLAAGRNDPAQALAYAAQHMRSNDLVCLGIYTGDNLNMLAEDVALFLHCLGA